MTIGGLGERPLALSQADLRALPKQEQITKHNCIHGWSAVAEWGRAAQVRTGRVRHLRPKKFNGFGKGLSISLPNTLGYDDVCSAVCLCSGEFMEEFGVHARRRKLPAQVHGAAPTPRSHQPASRPSYACPRARRLHLVTDFIQLTPQDAIIDLMGLRVTRRRRRK